MAYISTAESIGVSSTTFMQSVPKATEFGEITLPLGLRRSRSSKVTEFGTNRKLICDFLLVINSNFAPILHRFRDRVRKIFTERSWMAMVPNGIETLRLHRHSQDFSSPKKLSFSRRPQNTLKLPK